MRGQGSIEYFTIFSALLVIFAGVTMNQMVNPTSNLADETEPLAQARITSDKIANAINTVYSSDAPNTTMTEPVNFSKSWNLEINPDNLRIGVEINGETKWVTSNLKYGFDNSLLDISRGNYFIIVEWPENEASGINPDLSNNKIYIQINPIGGN